MPESTLTLPDSELARPEGFDAAEFYTVGDDHALVGPHDLDAVVPDAKKEYLEEIDRYWLRDLFSFAVVYHDTIENSYRYYVVEPQLTARESRLRTILDQRVEDELPLDQLGADLPPNQRIAAIRDTAHDLVRRWRLLDTDSHESDDDREPDGLVEQLTDAALSVLEDRAVERHHDDATDESLLPAVTTDDTDQTTLSRRQIDRIVYYLVRDSVGYDRIDPLMHDIRVEDVSCDGPDDEVFVVHTEHGQLVTNVAFPASDLDGFVERLANISGKGISRRDPRVDTTLPDGSRAQLTLADEVTKKGSNFTIRQFTEIPYTPIDLINWGTYSLEQMAYLWLCVENDRSMLFAGGTASGKTTTQNAVLMFAPATRKYVTIEDTPEIELPQKNTIHSLTRPSWSTDGRTAIEEYDLLEDALRQRPDYIVMGEVRGEEGRDLFQAMSTGHTTFTTFHADTPSEVVKRFTTDPINVAKPYFESLDVMVMQAQRRVGGRTVRRATSINEVRDASTDHVDVAAYYKWDPTTDEFYIPANDGERPADGESRRQSHVLADIRERNGWTEERLGAELLKRKVVLAYLIDNEYSDYRSVAGTIQGFLSDPEAVLALIARDDLGDFRSNLQSLSSLDIDVDEDRESVMPRPDPSDQSRAAAQATLREASDLLDRYRDVDIGATFARLSKPSVSEVVEATAEQADDATIRLRPDETTGKAGDDTDPSDDTTSQSGESAAEDTESEATDSTQQAADAGGADA